MTEFREALVMVGYRRSCVADELARKLTAGPCVEVHIYVL